jgi:hypothetical protein
LFRFFSPGGARRNDVPAVAATWLVSQLPECIGSEGRGLAAKYPRTAVWPPGAAGCGAVKPISWSDRDLGPWVPKAAQAASDRPQRNLIRLGPLDYSGRRGEGSIPVPLPPPAWPKPCILRAHLLAIKPSSSSDFSSWPRTRDRQSRLIILRKARFSPKLWTPAIRYGSRNSNVSSYL